MVVEGGPRELWELLTSPTLGLGEGDRPHLAELPRWRNTGGIFKKIVCNKGGKHGSQMS